MVLRMMVALWPVALRELERRERSRKKDSLVRDEMVERKWFKFELRGRQVVHFHTPHIKPPNLSFFFCLSQFQYEDTISLYSLRFFVIISASKNYRGTMGGCIDIMTYKK